MKISLIGGRGFIGSHLADRLQSLGAEVLIRTRGMPAQDCATAVHLFVMNERDAREFVEEYANHAERLILISSGDVYRAYGILIGKESGPLEPQPVNEDSPLRTALFPYPDHPGYDKIPAERTVLNANNRNCVLRLPAVYGPGDKHHRIGSWLKRLDAPPVKIGEAFAHWRWTHGYVENVAEAIALVATTPDTPSRIYNVGEAETPGMLERTCRWSQAAGFRAAIQVVPDSELPAEARLPYNLKQNLVMDSTRIREELGFHEIVNEDEALERSVAWEVETGYARRAS